MLIFLSLELSQNAVRKQLADEEEKEALTGGGLLMHEDISASHLISIGIDLEESQYVFY